MSVTEQHQQKQGEGLEIRVADIVNFFRTNRKRILVGGLIGLIVGALYAYSKPDLFTAQVSVMPEIQAKGSGSLNGLSSLAGLAGINIDNLNGQDAVRPDLYPNVLQSIPFSLDLLKQPIFSPKLGKRLALGAYMEEMNDGWLSRLLGGDKQKTQPKSMPPVDAELIEVTTEQNALINEIQADVVSTYDKKTGILTILATEPEAIAAATVAQRSLDYLTNYVTTYRTEKARRQVDFLRRQVADAKNRYQSTEFALSSYRDNNRAVYLNTAKVEEQRLQADYLLAQSVYSDLSKQLEQAKIKVQEETPVFKTLEPASVPLRKSGPKRLAIMFGCAIFGCVLVIIVRLMKTFKYY